MKPRIHPTLYLERFQMLLYGSWHLKWLLPLLILVLLAGCSLKSIRQEFLGYSAGDVKSSKNKQVQTFDMSGPDCVNKIKDVLTSMGAIIREDRKKHYIYANNFQKVFRSTIDTTQVGIVVTWLEPNKCQVEIASDNTDLAAFLSKEITKKLKPEPEPTATR